MPNSIDQKIKRIEGLVRKAQGKKAQEELLKIKRSKIPKARLHEIANLLTRCGLEEMALNLMRPLVRPVKGTPNKPSDNDTMAYALALMRLGSESEAKSLLENIDAQKLPRASFILGILKMRAWDYQHAAVLFQQYLALEKDKYHQFTCKLNLAQSLILLDDFIESEQLLQEALLYAKIHHLESHHGNALAYLAGLEFYRGNLNKSQTYLQAAEGILRPAGGMDYFFVRKWFAILDLYLKKGEPASKSAFEKIRKEAIERSHWETVRDLDFHWAVFHNDSNQFLKLYFGTPYKSFRVRLAKHFSHAPVPESFLWRFDLDSEKTPKTIIDLQEGGKHAKTSALKPGKTLHRLYMTLTSDTYRRFSLMQLFENMFPNEHYNPAVSALRVHQGVKLLRKYFRDNAIPLSIETIHGFYYLSGEPSSAIRLTKQNSLAAEFTPLSAVKERLPAEFTVGDTTSFLGVSRSGAAKIVRKAVQAGELERLGRGKKVRYRFTSLPARKAA